MRSPTCSITPLRGVPPIAAWACVIGVSATPCCALAKSRFCWRVFSDAPLNSLHSLLIGLVGAPSASTLAPKSNEVSTIPSPPVGATSPAPRAASASAPVRIVSSPTCPGRPPAPLSAGTILSPVSGSITEPPSSTSVPPSTSAMVSWTFFASFDSLTPWMPPPTPPKVPPAMAPCTTDSIIRSHSRLPKASGLSSTNRSAAILIASWPPSVMPSTPKPANNPAVPERSTPGDIPDLSSRVFTTPVFHPGLIVRATP